LFRIVKNAFAHRRKTLRANLLAAFPQTLSRTTLAGVFTDLALNEHARAQELPVHQFVQLAQALQSLCNAERDAASHDMGLMDTALPP
jgi:16S rRNA A1518/A1519 N6-dimethyltransferase RsmA/KsgA/DIM1 with predicted DNA glycosylase/AP lyase activity